MYEIALANSTLRYPKGRSSKIYIGSSIARGVRNLWARIRDHISTARLANPVVYGYHANRHALQFRVVLENGVAARRAEEDKIRSFIRRFGCAPIGNHQNGRAEHAGRAPTSQKRQRPRPRPTTGRRAQIPLARLERHIILMFRRGVTYAEIASTVHRTVGTVHGIIWRLQQEGDLPRRR